MESLRQRGGGGGAVRTVSGALVLGALRADGGLSRAELARRLGLTRSTVSRQVSALIGSGYVREKHLSRGLGGRPGMLLELDPGGGWIVGLDLNIDVIGAVVTDFVGTVRYSRRVEFAAGDSQSAVLDQAAALVQGALSWASGQGREVLGIGVAVAGLVDHGLGTILYAPHLGWRDVALGSRWGSRFGLPVVVENEANAAVVGEYAFGGTEAARDCVFLSLGVGLAAGVFVNGRLLRGSQGFAGQVGHTVRSEGGLPCLCGRRGCWVTEVGLPAISRRLSRCGWGSAGAAGVEGQPASPASSRLHLTIQQLAEAAARGNADVLSVLAETGRHLGSGIADLVNVFDPETVILGGALSPLLPAMLEQARQSMDANLLYRRSRPVLLRLSSNGSWGSAIGAAAAVLDLVTQESVFLQVPSPGNRSHRGRRPAADVQALSSAGASRQASPGNPAEAVAIPRRNPTAEEPLRRQTGGTQ
ncbi:MAG: ROK family transcriptional regulator [Lentisphaeria bacterium]|nr:ROK family transcriptional regulator [Lentisphaeria bacterium]